MTPERTPTRRALLPWAAAAREAGDDLALLEDVLAYYRSLLGSLPEQRLSIYLSSSFPSVSTSAGASA